MVDFDLKTSVTFQLCLHEIKQSVSVLRGKITFCSFFMD